MAKRICRRICRPLLPSLTDDMFFEILACLPVKSLLRFKCVSKSWCNLIRSDTFISTHSRKQQSRNKLVLMRHNIVQPSQEKRTVLSFHEADSLQLEELWPNISTSTKFQNIEYGHRLNRILGPCNGLVLVVDQGDVFICNPSLRELKLLPHCPFSDTRGYYYNRGARSGDLIDIVMSGWGFGNTCDNDFNVVHLQCSIKQEYREGIVVSQSSRVKAHLYKSTTNSWKEIGYVGTLLTMTAFPRSEVFFNGACHWHTNLLSQSNSDYILTFDISTESFGRLEYPKCLREGGTWLSLQSLMVLNDCLSLVFRPSWTNEMQLYEVWVMKEYGIEESWSKQFVIGPCIITRPLLFWENKLLMESQKGELVSCALDTNEVVRFHISGIEETFRAVTYNESLISPKGLESRDINLDI